MKPIYSISCLSALAVIGMATALITGCDNKPSQPTSSSTVVSAEKTSFKEVTSQLDPGGEFYMYLGTAQWLDGLSGKINGLRSVVASLPNLKPEDSENINKGFDIVTRLVKDSGLEEISGLGLSSVQIEKGMYRNKALLHHYTGKGNGFLWKLSGKEPHALTGVDMLPSDTALAIFSDLDLPCVWTNIQKEVAASEIPKAQEFIQQLPVQFESKAGMKWDDLMHSLGGEFGFVLTLNPSNNVTIPLPGSVMQIPEPKILIAIKINDDTIFNRLDKELSANPQVIKVDKTELKMRTMPIPLPLPISLRPTAASTGGYLLIASTDALINEVLAVKSGKTPGLKSTEEFKHLAKGLPDRGNQFGFVSQRFGNTIMQLQQQLISANAKNDAAAIQMVQTLFTPHPTFAYSVGVNTPEGSLTVGNSSQGQAASTILLPAVAVSGMVAAIAIPNFVKAREAAQKNGCVNNLRQIEAAKTQWALENKKAAGDTPTKDDLLPFLQAWPTCPEGGTYSINSVDKAPTCSIPNHRLH